MAADSRTETDFADIGSESKLAALFGAFRRLPIVSIVIIVTLSLVAIFAPLLAPQSPIKSNLRDRNAPPFWYTEWYEENPKTTRVYALGADPIGRDLLSRLIHGARISMMVALVALISGTVIGTALGLAAGYAGGLTDEIITRVVDIWLGLPFILLALIVAVTIGSGVLTMMGLLAATAWSPFVRNVRAEVLTLRERDYVALARVAGASPLRILARHILPGVFNTVLVIATLRIGQLILTESFLSFLGAGIPPPTPTWGAMVADGREYLRDAWWVSVFAGIAIGLTVLALNFLGDWMRDTFDPRLRQV